MLQQKAMMVFFLIMVCNDNFCNANCDEKEKIHLGMSIEDVFSIHRFSNKENIIQLEKNNNKMILKYKYKPRHLFESMKKEWINSYYKFIFESNKLKKIYWIDKNEKVIEIIYELN